MNEKKNEKLIKSGGITLVALVITIIILLILAGITINSLTGSGLLQKAEESTKISKLKEIEELARLAYMDRKMEEASGGKTATVDGVMDDLRGKGYLIEEILSDNNTIIGVKLDEDKIAISKTQTKTITYDYKYQEGTVIRYFVELEGKNYEIKCKDDEFIVDTEETNLEEIGKKTEVKIESTNRDIVEVEHPEEGKIILTSKEELGQVDIIFTVDGSTTKLSVSVIIPTTSLEVESKTVKLGGTGILTCKVSPENADTNLKWFVEDETIIEILPDNTFFAKSEGTTNINVVDKYSGLTSTGTITVSENLSISSISRSFRIF